MKELSERKKKEMEWAKSIVAKVDNDERSFVKCKESRPITDLKHMLETSVELYGDNIAYLQKEGNSPYHKITYKEVLADVNAFGTSLIANGMKGKSIAVIGENCYQWALSYLAIACGTGIVVPLDKELSKAELKEQIQRAEIECVVFAKKHKKTMMEIRDEGDTPLKLLVNFNSEHEEDGVCSLTEMIEKGDKLIESGDRRFLDAEVWNDEMGILLFTSGTTGKSKGVMLAHKNICTELMVAPTIFTLFSEDRYFSVLPMHHTYECTCCFLMALYKGSSVAFCRGLKYIMKDIKEAEPTMMLGVPLLYEKFYNTIWKNVRKQGKEKMLKTIIKLNRKTKKVGIDLGNIFFKQVRAAFGGKMKTLICGGSAINPEILDGFRDFGFNALQGYGLTECAPMGAFNPEDEPISTSVGVPFPGLEIKAIDYNEEGIGELCVRGDHVMMGYYKMPEETAKVLDKDGWFHTGDLGYVDEKGYAYLTGRKKNVIITKNGKNVYPEEIEYQLSLIPFVEESFIFSKDGDGDSDTVIVASIRVDEEETKAILGNDYSEEDLMKLIWSEVDKINDSAPPYRMIKKVIHRKAEFVKNTSSKLIRFAEENKMEM